MRILSVVFCLAGTAPVFAADANSLIMGTMNDWFNAKSNVTQQAAAIMVARDHNAGVSARDLWSCLNEVAIGRSTGSEKVAQIAALCIVTMNGHK